jgi:hypothetical protein
MEEKIVNDLRYPIGKFAFEAPSTDDQRRGWIDDIAGLPALVRGAVNGLDDARLDTTYRPGGWTVRQVVHHLPDSHLNSYLRFRKALTEDTPTISPYDEAAWAELADARTAPVASSLALLEGLHARWVVLLRSLEPQDFVRAFAHPESGREVALERNLALYSWHGKHHLAHITRLKERLAW